MIICIVCILLLKNSLFNNKITDSTNNRISKMSPQDFDIFKKIKECVSKNNALCLNKILKIEHNDLNFQFIVEPPQTLKSKSLKKIIVKNISNREIVIIEPKISRVSDLYESKGYMQCDYLITFYISNATWCHLLQPNQNIIIPIDSIGNYSDKKLIFKKGLYKLNYNISVPIYNQLSLSSASGNSKTIQRVSCTLKVIDNNHKIEFKSMQ